MVDVVGTNFGDFARQVMRILYTTEELKTCILPPKRSYLVREPLDPERFRLLNGNNFFSFSFIFAFF